MSATSLWPSIKRFPTGDTEFATAVDSSVESVGGRRVSDPGVVAAIQALLRETYPLASLRESLSDAGLPPGWEAFRDEAVRDAEMIERAREGDERAFDELYDRHHLLAYHVAVQVAGHSDAAASAVVAAYRSVIAGGSENAAPVGVRLAIAARRAALVAAPGLARSSRQAMARAVVELAGTHSLKRVEIATVLGIHDRDVPALANEGLNYMATRLRSR